MKKLKTHKGASKRFKITGTGKVKYKKANLRHLLTGKPSGRKRNLGKADTLNTTQSAIIRKMLPYL
ncbi:MAG: 50S ribosomal protein L35 [Proteobacteria bacterium]|nr:50S ribosomal protein L35 [Pseudomonadota bacterium]